LDGPGFRIALDPSRTLLNRRKTRLDLESLWLARVADYMAGGNQLTAADEP
jgi:hypothetical protein